MDAGKLLEIRTNNQRFTNNPNEKFLLMILGSQAKLENDNRRINVKRGLRARAEMGLWPCTAPTGYLNSKNKDECCQVKIDPQRAPIIKKMFEKVAYERYSGRKLYMWLTHEIRFQAKSGKPLTLSNVYPILRNHFYYGIFEYPRGSGKWYQGKHEPIITKELFDAVQANISEHIIKNDNKEFAFTKLIKCGLCGSGITADEKYKQLKDGTSTRYVYYSCSKYNDKKCKCGYMREEKLIKQLAKLIDQIDIDEIGIKEKIRADLEKHKRFQVAILGEKSGYAKVTDIDIRNYAKYMLREGTISEKRELLSCLNSQIIIENKQVLAS